MQEDGCLESACVNAACLALLDASVSLKFLVASVTVALMKGGHKSFHTMNSGYQFLTHTVKIKTVM